MERTNIYLSDEQLRALRLLSEQRDSPVAELVRQAIDAWLAAQGVRVVEEDEWAQRFESLLDRRRATASGVPTSAVDRDVKQAVREARRLAAARRR